MSDRINLIILPFAGGNYYSFRSFIESAPEIINVIPLELPGRGSRIREPLIHSLDELIDDIFQQVRNNLDSQYIIYGHSMGTLTGYLLARKIQKHNLPPPIHLIFSGAAGPSVEVYRKTSRSELPRVEFISMLRELGGIPVEILASVSLMDFFEPILRADFRCIEQYIHDHSLVPFDVPVTALIGDKESVTVKEASQWQEVTSFPIEVIEMAGDHFFIFNHVENILEIIKQRIKPFVSNER